MAPIADSSAIFDPERMLAQHQAALTLLQGMLSNPLVGQVRWLDLASGKGQIIAHLQKNLTEKARAKLQFVGYDIDNHHTRQAEKTAQAMGLAKCDFGIGELADFHRNDKTDGPWDFITLTNTVHEVSPQSLASILMAALERLQETGCLFVYDMDRLSSPELGAVLWTGSEFSEILTTLCTALGCPHYEPAVGTWSHRSCDGWNAQIKREHMQLPSDWKDRVAKAVEATVQCIEAVLKRKLTHTRKALEALTRFGAETGEEAADKERLLFDFWAITRALEVQK
jgi:SAM-dependent methyltransferase